MSSSQQNGHQEPDLAAEGDEGELAQAFKDLARGERTATALEQQLTSIEKKIDELLARADQDKKLLESQAAERQESQPSEDKGGGSTA